jgi:hypothetical protein
VKKGDLNGPPFDFIPDLFFTVLGGLNRKGRKAVAKFAKGLRSILQNTTPRSRVTSLRTIRSQEFQTTPTTSSHPYDFLDASRDDWENHFPAAMMASANSPEAFRAK